MTTTIDLSQWVTHTTWKNKNSITQEAGKKRPAGFTETRPATLAEVEAELEAREWKADRARARKAFEEREDYRYAESVRSIIEMMDQDNHPLDCLTVAEWKTLYERLKRQ